MTSFLLFQVFSDLLLQGKWKSEKHVIILYSLSEKFTTRFHNSRGVNRGDFRVYLFEEVRN